MMALCAALLVASHADAAEYFVASDGDNANAGTKEKPFATVQHAQEAVAPGDTVIIRGGKYLMREEQIARRNRGWAYVTLLDKSGTKEKPITYKAADGERPVFDLSNVKPQGLRVHAFQVNGSWLHIIGLEVVGVQVTAKGHTQSICFASDGNHNIYERLSMHDGQAIGIYSQRGADNLFLNCDAYNNWDYTSENQKGGNVDGFGCHPIKGATGNVFRGCRAWFNSDDGYDCISAHEAVIFENCWAFYNGTNAKSERLADGNGFKAGGFGSLEADRLPNPIPRHTVRFCLAVGNRASGFYANHQPGGGDWFNNTAYRNGTNFNMLCRLADNKTDVDGYGQKLRNNLSFKSRADLAKFDATKSDAANNSFTLDLKPNVEDFLSLDEGELMRPRQANGDLPVINFLHLAEKSSLRDKGVDIGFPFKGARPQLGAFER